MFDFEFLQRQVAEGLIVEDTETLAAISLLVPDLMKIVERATEHAAAAAQALHKAEAVLREL